MNQRVSPKVTMVESSGGVVIPVHDYGGSGDTIIFCHATGFHGRYWDPICERLPDGFRCVSLDFRGHGDSSIPDGLSMDWIGMAEDLLCVVDHLDIEPVLAVGHSMGGSSILLAEQIRPRTFTAAWLFEPIVISPEIFAEKNSKGSGLAAAARKRKETFASREEAYERYASRPPFSEVDSSALWAYVNYGFRDHAEGVILKCRGETEAQVFESSLTTIYENLSTVQASVTVAGGGDKEGPAQIAPKIAQELVNGRFEMFPELTHFAPMEDPDFIATKIRNELIRTL
ncbi:MAG: hypothetical protein CL431_07295 [Acidimicrobiaceae bacterium]|jgi:pimeloyl-ACP methyl ester carboxylesterase|nr:hypothetical protein [Acidimicrobiaceae bacterium]|tara:strand:- start:5621 stop:6478 length:858 start_codon:yes stop_codon:yes gene_type:complete